MQPGGAGGPGMAASDAALVLKAYAVVWSMVHEAFTTRSQGDDQATKAKLQQMAICGSEIWEPWA